MKNFIAIMKTFTTTSNSYKLLRRMRWRKGVYCPNCGVLRENHVHQTKKNGCRKYKCTACQHVFSDTSGTIFHRSKIPINVWFFALYEMSHTKGITSVELGKRLGIPQRSAWNILHKLRENFATLAKAFVLSELKGIVESDEGNFGRGGNAVMGQGIVQRKGKAVILPISDRKERTLKGNIEKRVRKGSKVMTDTASSYIGLSCSGYDHYTLNHSKEEFSKGNGIHSNTIEGLWGNLKKILYGVHHGVRKKNVWNYIAEFLWKYNYRDISQPFYLLISHTCHPPLTC